MIVAHDLNRAIGRKGDLPWRQRSDLRMFKEKTMDSNIIMGRKTWDSLPGKLPGREHFVLSRNEVEGVEVITFEQAIQMDGWIIGGGQIYELFLPQVDELHITVIQTEVSDADTFFPLHSGFTLSTSIEYDAGEGDEFDMVVQVWKRDSTQ